jgi:hypothetical protein
MPAIMLTIKSSHPSKIIILKIFLKPVANSKISQIAVTEMSTVVASANLSASSGEAVAIVEEKRL